MVGMFAIDNNVAFFEVRNYVTILTYKKKIWQNKNSRIFYHPEFLKKY